MFRTTIYFALALVLSTAIADAVAAHARAAKHVVPSCAATVVSCHVAANAERPKTGSTIFAR